MPEHLPPGSIILGIIKILLNIDQNPPDILAFYGLWNYLILFVIITLETCLVVTLFLPGDSLLFVVILYGLMKGVLMVRKGKDSETDGRVMETKKTI